MHTSDKMNPPTSANNNNNSSHRETEGEEPSTCDGATNGVVVVALTDVRIKEQFMGTLTTIITISGNA